MKKAFIIFFYFLFSLKIASASVFLNVDQDYAVRFYVLTEAGIHASGLDLYIEIEKTSDGKYFDFDDNTFKDSGWVQKKDSMIEDALNSVYKYFIEFPASERRSNDVYRVRISCEDSGYVFIRDYYLVRSDIRDQVLSINP